VSKVLTLFGTRPEVVKLAPVVRHLEADGASLRTVNVCSGQHDDLLRPFLQLFLVRVDHDLKVMQPDQSPSRVCSRVLLALDGLLERERPDLMLVQGDTSTAMAGALAGFHRGVPVGHVEAGLRSGDVSSPYPEEMNRRLITRLATYHFAATQRNRRTLLEEGVDESRVFVTGNPVVDAVNMVLARASPSAALEGALAGTEGLRRIVLTTHRRESFGATMAGNMKALRRFVDSHEDAALLFPVHLNPVVVGAASSLLSSHPRIRLLPPLGYEDFLVLLSRAFLIVSDSGGVQEEAPTLGRPLLVLRENTERPEAIECGIARLVGGRPERLSSLLEEAWRPGSWAEGAERIENPFGTGDSGRRIAGIVSRLVASPCAATAGLR
jgi:UDP-N-acetylglucosamine 2-epimerase (non-hydrolysing)